MMINDDQCMFDLVRRSYLGSYKSQGKARVHCGRLSRLSRLSPVQERQQWRSGALNFAKSFHSPSTVHHSTERFGNGKIHLQHVWNIFFQVFLMVTMDCILQRRMGMDQYLLIPFLGGWTSIYQLFWCSPGVQGFDTLPYPNHLQASIRHQISGENEVKTSRAHQRTPNHQALGPSCSCQNTWNILK